MVVVLALVPFSVSPQPRMDAPGDLSELWELSENKSAAECRPLWLLPPQQGLRSAAPALLGSLKGTPFDLYSLFVPTPGTGREMGWE